MAHVAQLYKQGRGNHVVDVTIEDAEQHARHLDTGESPDVPYVATCDNCTWEERWYEYKTAIARSLRHSVGQGKED